MSCPPYTPPKTITTKAGIDIARAGDKVDYTKFRRTRYVKDCPRCGRKGQKTPLLGGRIVFIHEAQIGSFEYPVKTDYCEAIPGRINEGETP